MTVHVGKTQFFTMDFDGEFHMVGYHGTARQTRTRWALQDLAGNVVRYTTSEQVAVDYCRGL